MAGKKKETFDDRLRIHYDELKWLYMELYENDDMFGELCEQMLPVRRAEELSREKS